MTAQRIRALIALDPAVDRELVQRALPDETAVELVGVVDVHEGSWAQLDDTPCDVVMLACTDSSAAVLPFVEGAVRAKPGRPVIVLVDSSPNGFVRRAFAAGAEDILVMADGATPHAVQFALEKAVARRQGGGSGQSGTPAGAMICVLGPKGGAGKTLTACNLAVALAAAGERVAVLDLAQFGDVALTMGLTPGRTLYDLATSGGTLDSGKLEAYLTTHASGARTLLAPTRPDQASHVTVEFLRDLYPVLRRMHDVVVVDTPPSFTPEVVSAIQASSDVCLVGMLDSLALKSTKLGMEALERMGYDREHVHLVLNRADSRVGITAADVESVVGRGPDVLVPSHRDIAQSVNEGVPIAMSQPRSDAARAFATLAGRWSTKLGSAASGDRSARRRLLKRSA